MNKIIAIILIVTIIFTFTACSSKASDGRTAFQVYADLQRQLLSNDSFSISENLKMSSSGLGVILEMHATTKVADLGSNPRLHSSITVIQHDISRKTYPYVATVDIYCFDEYIYVSSGSSKTKYKGEVSDLLGGFEASPIDFTEASVLKQSVKANKLSLEIDSSSFNLDDLKLPAAIIPGVSIKSDNIEITVFLYEDGSMKITSLLVHMDLVSSGISLPITCNLYNSYTDINQTVVSLPDGLDRYIEI